MMQLNIARNDAERIRCRMISMKRKRMVQKHHRRPLILRSDDEWWPFNIENEGMMPLLHTIIGRY